MIYQPGQMVEPASTPVAPEAADPGPEANSGNNYARRDAVLNLRLPESAVVYVNGKKTKTPGTFRSYVSKNLQVGKNYSYQVRIELDQDGETLTRTKVVELTAGANKTFDIDFDVEPELITSLTLFVPDDAKVELGGAETAATGPMRYFSTKSLGKGQSWNDYVVSVTITRDGQKVTKNRVIDVQAGESVDLRFDFEGENSVASR